MPPITVHLNAPINPNAAKADGISPETSAVQNPQQQQATPTRTIATPTDPYLPPPPQPGAVPQPSFTAAPSSTFASPPRPQPGASATSGYIPASVTASVTNTITKPVGPPPQFSMPPPTTNATPTRSTTTAAAAPAHAAYPGQTTLNMGPAPTMTAVSEHPPGYVQNPYAGDGTAAQRARLEDVKAQEEGVGEGMWGSVKGVLGKMGEGLKKGEEEAWKFVEGRKGSGF